MATGGSETSLQAWLQFLHIEKYYDHLSAMGYDARSLAQLSDSELAELGLPLGPRKKICLNAGLMLSSCSSSPSCNAVQAPNSTAARQAPVWTGDQGRSNVLPTPGPAPPSATVTDLAQQHRPCQLVHTAQHRPAAQQVTALARPRQQQDGSARSGPTYATTAPIHGHTPGLCSHDRGPGVSAYRGENITDRRSLARASWPEPRRVAFPTWHPPTTTAMPSALGPAESKACHKSASPSNAVGFRVHCPTPTPRYTKDTDPSAMSSAPGRIGGGAPGSKAPFEVASERASLAQLYPLNRQAVHPTSAHADRPAQAEATGNVREGDAHDTSMGPRWQARGRVLKRFRSWDGSATCTLQQSSGSQPRSASSGHLHQVDCWQGQTLYTAAASALPVDCSIRAIKKAADSRPQPQLPSDDLQVRNVLDATKTGDDSVQEPHLAAGAAAGHHAGAPAAGELAPGYSLLDDPRNFETPELLAQLLYDETPAVLGPAAEHPLQDGLLAAAPGRNDTWGQGLLSEGGSVTRHQRLARVRALREEVAATERLLETLRGMVAAEEAALAAEEAAGARVPHTVERLPPQNEPAETTRVRSGESAAVAPAESHAAASAAAAARGADFVEPWVLGGDAPTQRWDSGTLLMERLRMLA